MQLSITRAVTAFDVVGLFCIFGMPPYGFMPQLRHAHCNTLHIYCQDNAIFSAKKTAAQAFTGAAIYPKMQGNHPLYPHSTHYPHFVKHFLPHFRANRSVSDLLVFISGLARFNEVKPLNVRLRILGVIKNEFL